VTEHAEQDLPKHNDGPSAHDLVIRDMLSRDPRWDLSYGTARHLRDRAAEGLRQRKALGLERYGTILQPFNNRDSLRDLHEELMDAACYARNRMLEISEDSLEWAELAEIYDELVGHLVKVQRIRDAVRPENVAPPQLPKQLPGLEHDFGRLESGQLPHAESFPPDWNSEP
jgi:hypothetical protein